MAVQWNTLLTPNMNGLDFWHVLMKSGKALKKFHQDYAQRLVKRECLKLDAWVQAASVSAALRAADQADAQQ